MPPTNYLRRSLQKSVRAPAVHLPAPRSLANSSTHPRESPHADKPLFPLRARGPPATRPGAAGIRRPLSCRCRSSPPPGCTSSTISGSSALPAPFCPSPPAPQRLLETLASHLLAPCRPLFHSCSASQVTHGCSLPACQNNDSTLRWQLPRTILLGRIEIFVSAFVPCI